MFALNQLMLLTEKRRHNIDVLVARYRIQKIHYFPVLYRQWDVVMRIQSCLIDAFF